MDLIKPPPLRNTMIRQGKAIDADVISELGIYGVFVRYVIILKFLMKVLVKEE
jgi:hypothetical protein